jgi:hypothetical protein
MSVSACGGSSSPTAPSDSPTTPTPAANIVVPSSAGLSLPGCDPRILQAKLLGLTSIDCPSFSGTLQNTGAGCAVNARRVTTIFNQANQQIGSAGWSYANTVSPGEQFAYSGGAINVPTNSSILFTTSPSWDNVRCQ